MSKKPFTRLSRKQVFECPYYSIQHETYVLPNDDTGDYYIVHRPPTAMVIPETAQQTFILTKQYRYISKKWSIEFPAGTGEKMEEYSDIAARELLEECGVTARRLKQIAAVEPFNGISDEICAIFHATELELTNPSPDPDEEISQIELTAKEIDDLIESNTIVCGITIAAWCLYKQLIK